MVARMDGPGGRVPIQLLSMMNAQRRPIEFISHFRNVGIGRQSERFDISGNNNADDSFVALHQISHATQQFW